MSGAELAFLALAAVSIVTALGVVTAKNPVVAAVLLVACFCGVAGCYVLLFATFLAAIQVLVYAGAMMVLFVFVIMVLEVDEKGDYETHGRRRARWGRGVLVGGSGAFLLWVVVGTWARQYLTEGAALAEPRVFGTATGLGRELFTRYVFAFEIVSLPLLAAVIAAVVVARSRREREIDHGAHTGQDARALAKARAGAVPEARLRSTKP